MVERTVLVINRSGLHARPAALFVQAAARFPCRIRLARGDREVDAKSILGVLSLGVHKDTEVTIRAAGLSEEQAVEHLAVLIESGLGEP